MHAVDAWGHGCLSAGRFFGKPFNRLDGAGAEPGNCLIHLCIHVDWIWCQRMRHFLAGFDV